MYDYNFPKQKQIRMIVNTDAKNEADDQFAVVHQILSPKFEIKGFIAAHFENRGNKEYDSARKIPAEGSMEESYKELKNLLKIMDMSHKYKVYRGATHPITDKHTPVMSEGAQFIIEEAMKDDDKPLFAVFLGTLTDLASAYIAEPRIAERLNVVWIGGGVWPIGCPEFNLMQDINAANVVFASDLPLWQVPINAYLQVQVTFAELQLKVRPYGKIGKYLFEQLNQFNYNYAKYLPHLQGDTWVLGDQPTVSVLLDANHNNYEWHPAPLFSDDMLYIHQQKNRPIRVYKYIDRHMTLEDFFAKLAINYPQGEL